MHKSFLRPPCVNVLHTGRKTGWIRVPMSSDQAPHGPAWSHSLVWTQ